MVSCRKSMLMTKEITLREDDIRLRSISVTEMEGYELVDQEESTMVSLFHRKGSAFEKYDIALSFFASLFIGENNGEAPREVKVSVDHPAIALRQG